MAADIDRAVQAETACTKCDPLWNWEEAVAKARVMRGTTSAMMEQESIGGRRIITLMMVPQLEVTGGTTEEIGVDLV